MHILCIKLTSHRFQRQLTPQKWLSVGLLSIVQSTTLLKTRSCVTYTLKQMPLSPTTTESLRHNTDSDDVVIKMPVCVCPSYAWGTCFQLSPSSPRLWRCKITNDNYRNFNFNDFRVLICFTDRAVMSLVQAASCFRGESSTSAPRRQQTLKTGLSSSIGNLQVKQFVYGM